MEAPIKTRYDKAGPQVAEALRRRHFEAHYVSTAQEALDLALTLIPKDRTVSWGGTVTAAQIGLMDRLHQGDYQLIDRDTGKTPAEKQELMRQALTCGTFIMSSNAISADGQLVNLDGNANRVAALCFGPESVLVIAGMNKVMGDLDSAIAGADLVITGEGRTDRQTLMGKLPYQVAQRAKKLGKRCVVISGDGDGTLVGDKVITLTDKDTPPQAAIAHAAALLAEKADLLLQ